MNTRGDTPVGLRMFVLFTLQFHILRTQTHTYLPHVEKMIQKIDWKLNNELHLFHYVLLKMKFTPE